MKTNECPSAVQECVSQPKHRLGCFTFHIIGEQLIAAARCVDEANMVSCEMSLHHRCVVVGVCNYQNIGTFLNEIVGEVSYSLVVLT